MSYGHAEKNRVDMSFCFSFVVLLDEFGKASLEAAKADAKVVLDDGMWNR
jgi:hypothetical protein